jgi:uncharacterized membrane protein
MQRFARHAIAFLSLAVALYALVMYGVVPFGKFIHPDMRPAFLEHAFAIRLHVFSAVFALALGSLQFSSRVRARFPRAHRIAGRLYLGVGVVIGGLSGLYIALHAFGGPIAQSGFALLALAWLYTGFEAYRAIRHGDVATHRQWMVRNWALTLAAVTLRIYLPVGMVPGVDFEAAYRAIAWLCWVPNLLVAHFVLARRIASPARGGIAAPGARPRAA